uniref:Uncharacterized protein n=1 Tax=viral metagenome TaxID=1070528 RepID=A0A6C0CTN6_9ZZZZ
MLSSTPAMVHPTGMVVATSLPPQVKTAPSSMSGGILNAAAAKTSASIAEQAAHAKAGGVYMKGGGQPINVPPVPEGRSIAGISFAKNHADLIGTANQLKAGAVYDGLIGSQPYKVGGRRHPRVAKTHRRRFIRDPSKMPHEEFAMTAGRKHKRKTKKHGRQSSRSRTHHRRLHRRVRRSRRTRRGNSKR